jgi:hypothetical protein
MGHDLAVWACRCYTTWCNTSSIAKIQVGQTESCEPLLPLYKQVPQKQGSRSNATGVAYTTIHTALIQKSGRKE